MKRILFIVFSLFIFLIISIRIINIFKPQKIDRRSGKIRINQSEFTVEIADTEILRTKGLSGRKTMLKDTGMLFIFPTSGIYNFWMKEMHFPLDFIWINQNKIVDITENVASPSPNTPDNQLTIYNPKMAVDKVLELNVGAIQSSNAKIGDIVYLML